MEFHFQGRVYLQTRQEHCFYNLCVWLFVSKAHFGILLCLTNSVKQTYTIHSVLESLKAIIHRRMQHKIVLINWSIYRIKILICYSWRSRQLYHYYFLLWYHFLKVHFSHTSLFSEWTLFYTLKYFSYWIKFNYSRFLTE